MIRPRWLRLDEIYENREKPSDSAYAPCWMSTVLEFGFI
ncbi:Hypothetical protein Cul210932_1481 [Corynebacterium ulcerans]|uniref:Uncharacterized protein n=1 Tax=Corynebacterium ulcerans FRC58 TaxID=1408268 RepID=A0ABM5U1G5_CORUL|nr:Hypothetical protein Cul210932_1481 [Corynebacterium ulcerans]AIU92010.1 Hypothetical protein Cul05146_1448 [Corynebacterium ulcerans]AKN77302.1 Hypothetical protein CulFRC58_1448 [Corynebacterium ulcerans FRC58]ALD95199.1 Hypothetical protein Cul131001_1503 [Corynebacterium ulcerans]